MSSMLVTWEVSKPDRSREASFEQPSNMPPMSVTLEVSRPDRSREESDEQPLKSSRRHVVIRRAVLSHHRANGSVHGGSLNLHVPFHTELRKIDNPYGLVARF